MHFEQPLLIVNSRLGPQPHFLSSAIKISKDQLPFLDSSRKRNLKLPTTHSLDDFTGREMLGFPKVIHPKYYTHLKEAASSAQSFGQIKNGLVSCRLACTLIKT